MDAAADEERAWRSPPAMSAVIDGLNLFDFDERCRQLRSRNNGDIDDDNDDFGGGNSWLPAYGFQPPQTLLDKDDFINNPGNYP